MLDKLTAMIREQTGDSSISIQRDTVLLTDLGLNSFDLMNLVCLLEDEWDIEIPERVIINFKTIGDVMDYIEQHSSF